ncbi:MAG TPA: hypothetical protein VGZ47_19040, partial [Gemmataceae bacterium]|nr:hypothetical protein [Gemmataceae bacterium]
MPPGLDRNGTLSDRVRSLRLGDRTTPGGSRSSIVPWTLAAICLLMTLGFAYYAYHNRAQDSGSPEVDKLKQKLDKARPEAREQAMKILEAGENNASKDVAGSGDVVLESKGYLTPIHQIQMSPQVGGEIIWLDPAFKEG